jgi:hypothetical protein
VLPALKKVAVDLTDDSEPLPSLGKRVREDEEARKQRVFKTLNRFMSEVALVQRCSRGFLQRYIGGVAQPSETFRCALFDVCEYAKKKDIMDPERTVILQILLCPNPVDALHQLQQVRQLVPGPVYIWLNALLSVPSGSLVNLARFAAATSLLTNKLSEM